MTGPDEKILAPFLGPRTQAAWVVSELEASARYWSETLGIGPFILIESSLAGREAFHRGQPSRMDMALAFSYTGELMVELISPINDEPSPYKEFLESGREGLHHLGFWPDDVEATARRLEGAGFVEVFAIRNPDGTNSTAYYEAPRHMGMFMEIVPLTPARRLFFDKIKSNVDNWDGMRPLRRYATREEFMADEAG